MQGPGDLTPRRSYYTAQLRSVQLLPTRFGRCRLRKWHQSAANRRRDDTRATGLSERRPQIRQLLVATSERSGTKDLLCFQFRDRWPLVLVVVAGFWLYSGVLAGLVNDWANDDNYSHGFLIVPLAAVFRLGAARSAAAPRRRRRSVLGLVVVRRQPGHAGRRHARRRAVPDPHFDPRRDRRDDPVPARLAHLRVLAFPLAFLLLMIPIPAIIFNQIAFPLQLFASRVRRGGDAAGDVPVLREGNVIVLANTTLEVAEACSGIRSLISLLTLGIVYGYFTDSGAGCVRS